MTYLFESNVFFLILFLTSLRSLVWGHFCLCYDGQKLTNDKAYIRNYGIKDGDQVCVCAVLFCSSVLYQVSQLRETHI